LANFVGMAKVSFNIKTPQTVTVKDWIAARVGGVQFVASMSNQTPEQVRNLPLNVFETLKAKCEEVIDMVEPTDPHHGVAVGGVTYSIVPDFMDFEAGAMIDISEADERELTKYYTIVLSALFRPVLNRVGKFYTVEAYKATQRPELLNLPLRYFRGAEAFFLTINKELMTTSLNSLKEQTAKMRSLISQNQTKTRWWRSMVG